MKKTVLKLVVLLLFVSGQIMAQTRAVTGIVRDKGNSDPIAGANVQVKGTGIGTVTDDEGKFTLSVPESSNALIFSFVGYVTVEVTIPTSNVVNVSLESASSELEEIVVTVGRGIQRTQTDTPLPVDNLSSRDLSTTGQFTFDKALQYRVPSFNTVNTPMRQPCWILMKSETSDPAGH